MKGGNNSDTCVCNGWVRKTPRSRREYRELINEVFIYEYLTTTTFTAFPEFRVRNGGLETKYLKLYCTLDSLAEDLKWAFLPYVLEAMNSLHNVGVIHNDLHSRNVLVKYNAFTNKFEDVKIIDYGDAVVVNRVMPGDISSELLNLKETLGYRFFE